MERPSLKLGVSLTRLSRWKFLGWFGEGSCRLTQQLCCLSFAIKALGKQSLNKVKCYWASKGTERG